MDCFNSAFRLSSRGCLKFFCFTIFTIVCLIQLYIIARSFFQYPRKIHSYDSQINMIGALPGVTLCNNNRISLRKLMARNPQIAKAVTERFPNYVINNEPQVGRDFYEFRSELDKTLRFLNYSSETEENNSTMNNLFNLRPDQTPFIKLVRCRHTLSDNIECESISRLDSVQDRRCITFLHTGALYYDSINRKELFNNSKPKQGTEGSFDSREIVRFEIDFDPEDYADLKRQVGARLIFHNKHYAASSTELDYFITRGFKYEFSIDLTATIFLGKPYDLCTNAYNSNLHLYKDKIDPRIPLYGDTCFHNCLIRNMINIYQCWPPTLPYFRNDSFDPHLNVRPCPWLDQKMPLFKEFANVSEWYKPKTMEISRTYMRMRRYCWTKCVLPCRLSRYVVGPAKAVWPSDVQLLFDKTGSKRKLRHCCAQVRVRYINQHYKVQQYTPKYNLLDVVQDIGGLLAVWLGLSIISVYHAIQKLVDICAQQSTRRRRRRRGIKADQASSSQ